MNNYTIKWKSSAVKELSSIPKQYAKKIIESIDELQYSPRPPDCRKLRLFNNIYRIKISNYRVIYSIQDNILLIEIIKIGHRKEVYR